MARSTRYFAALTSPPRAASSSSFSSSGRALTIVCSAAATSWQKRIAFGGRPAPGRAPPRGIEAPLILDRLSIAQALGALEQFPDLAANGKLARVTPPHELPVSRPHG